MRPVLHPPLSVWESAGRSLRTGGRSSLSVGVVGSEGSRKVWERRHGEGGPLSFVIEASYNPGLKDHAEIMGRR